MCSHKLSRISVLVVCLCKGFHLILFWFKWHIIYIWMFMRHSLCYLLVCRFTFVLRFVYFVGFDFAALNTHLSCIFQNKEKKRLNAFCILYFVLLNFISWLVSLSIINCNGVKPYEAILTYYKIFIRLKCGALFSIHALCLLQCVSSFVFVCFWFWLENQLKFSF